MRDQNISGFGTKLTATGGASLTWASAVHWTGHGWAWGFNAPSVGLRRQGMCARKSDARRAVRRNKARYDALTSTPERGSGDAGA